MSRMGATLGTLAVLKILSEGAASRERLLARLEEEFGIGRDERTLRRYVSALREAGFEIRSHSGKLELVSSPVRLPFDEYEALAALSLLESVAGQEPVYGGHLASAAGKLRRALPEGVLKFVDRGRVEFDLSPASDPPEDPHVIDTLRQAAYRNQRIEMHYYSLSSGESRWRVVEPVRVYHAQRAHRLYAYDPESNEYREFRVNRIGEAKMLPDKFSPEAHTRQLKPARVWLNEKTFAAYGKYVIPDPHATVKPQDDGTAIVEGSVANIFWTVRDIAALGPGARVLGGPELKEEFLQFLRLTLNQYS